MRPVWIDFLVGMKDRNRAALRLAAAFLATQDTERAAVVAGWPFGVDWEYPSPWRLACQKGELGLPRERIITSLVLNALDSFEEQSDQVTYLGIIYNSCILARLDPHQLFLQVAKTLPTAAASLLLAFDARDESQKAMEEFLLIAKTAAFGEAEIHFLPNYFFD